MCGAPGIIKSIDVTAQTGTTVTVDLGNGYEVLYGQLKEVPVKVGDQVEAKKHSRLYRTADKSITAWKDATYIWNYEKMEYQ